MKELAIVEKWRPWILLVTMVFMVLLINLDYTAVNMAIKPISRDLNADLGSIQWMLSGYILAWAASVVAAGKLADIFGKRRILLLGILAFTLASLWCGLAWSEPVLIAGRLFQGLGGALFVPPLYTLIFSVFPENKQGMAIGALGLGVGIGLAIGPTFGGVLLQYLSWRWIFFINVPLCALTLLVTLLCTEKEPPRVSDEKFDLAGSLMLGLSLMMIVYGIDVMEEWGVFSLGVWSLIGSGALILAAFIYTSHSKSNKLIPEGLFFNKAFLGCVIGYTAVEFVFSLVLFVVGLYLQNILGYTPYEGGIIFLAMTITFGLLSPFGGKMVDHMDARVPAALGLGILLLGLCLTLMYTTSENMLLVYASLALVGVGFGIALPTYNAAMMKSVDPSILSTASGVFVMFAALGGSLGVVFSSSIILGVGEPLLSTMTQVHRMDLSSVQMENLMHVYASAYRELELLTGMNVDLAVQLMNNAFVQANWWNLLSACVLVAAGLVVSFRLIKIPKKVSA